MILAWKILSKEVLFLRSNGGIDTYGVTVLSGVGLSFCI